MTEKKRRGRPPAEKKRTASANLRAYPEWLEWLRAASEATGIDQDDIVAEGVELWARKHKIDPPPAR